MTNETVQRKTVVVVAAVIVRGGRVLLTQRPGQADLGGLWEFPGGKLEADESPEEALRRELREEIGVTAEVGEIVEVTFWRYPQKNVLLLFYRATITAGEVEDLEVAAHRWERPEGLDGLAFPPADGPVLDKVREMLSVKSPAP
ncbi:MAG: (deoxy)nucleoside triphosphate pyrophosphohydrolase [Myxococcales bacterium]|nr:(deoxy)nucleoside triphosphate pyrophosphohydrolase [Myxococcales bacterium]